MKARAFVALLLVLLPSSLKADQFQLLLGPPSLGQGGSNPVSVPPLNPMDWQLSYVHAKDREWVFSLVPGVLYGQRFYKNNFYAALGGGALVTSSGLAIGFDHAYGYETQPFASNLRFLAEYRQVIGLGRYGWQFPYTFRLGVSYAF